MKPKAMLTMAATVAVLIHSGLATAALPEFKSREEVRAIRAEQAAVRKNAVQAEVQISEASTFFTGKAADSQTRKYLFLCRNYDPELSRWSTVDPSGFPDGANNFRFLSDPISFVDPDGLAGKKVAYIYAYTGQNPPDNSSSNGAPFIQATVQGHMDKMAQADANNPDLKYVSDGDYISFGSINNPSQLSSYSSYDRIYVAAHGVFNSGGTYTGNVRIGGQDYAASSVTASNLESFLYCGSGVVTPWNPGGIVSSLDVSGQWFWNVQDYFLE